MLAVIADSATARVLYQEALRDPAPEIGRSRTIAHQFVDDFPRRTHISASKQELRGVMLMSVTRDQLGRDAAARGKYAPLYRSICNQHP